MGKKKVFDEHFSSYFSLTKLALLIRTQKVVQDSLFVCDYLHVTPDSVMSTFVIFWMTPTVFVDMTTAGSAHMHHKDS